MGAHILRGYALPLACIPATDHHVADKTRIKFLAFAHPLRYNGGDVQLRRLMEVSMFVTEADGEQRVGDYLPVLGQAIRRADAQLANLLTTAPHRAKVRSVSSLRNDFVVSEMRRVTSGDSRTRWSSERGRDVMWIDNDRAAIVFKQLDGRKRLSIPPTQQSLLFFGQMEMAGMPSQTPRFTTSWQLDALRVGVSKSYLILSDGRVPVWSIGLDNFVGGTGTAGNPVPIVPPAPSAPQAAGPRVRRKSGDNGAATNVGQS